MLSNHKFQSPLRKGWTILVAIMVVSLLLSGCGGAQQSRVYHVGILSGLDFFANTADGFKAKMAELGYVEGKNIVYDMQKTNFETDREEQILKKFVADKVDLIFVFPTEVSIAAKAATQGTNIPVLFAQANIEGMSLVNSVREPGGNITGVRYPGPDLALKRFEIMRELMPQAKRIYLPYQKGYPNVGPQLEALHTAAAAAGVTFIEVPLSSAAELDADLQARVKTGDIGFDAVVFMAEPLGTLPDVNALINKFAVEHNVPIGGGVVSPGGGGTIFALSTDSVAVGQQAAPLADKILKGIQAGTIPVASAEGILKINYKAAQALGITVSDGLLKTASEIIR